MTLRPVAGLVVLTILRPEWRTALRRGILGIDVGNVVNLNRFRKRKRESEERARADARAVQHGETPDERDRVARERERQDALLDGARREPVADTPGSEDPDAG